MDKNKALKSKKEIRLQKAEKARLKQKKAQERQKLMPLIKAFGLWIVLVLILNIPSLKETFAGFFVDLTVKSVLGLSKLLFLPVVHLGGQNISVNGYNLQIIYECTAYNFYLFVIPLVIFSNWEIKAKLLNLIIFIGAIVIANFSRFIITFESTKASPGPL